MEIEIREAAPADVAVIAQFNARMALETEQLTLDRPRLLRGVEAVVRDPAKGRYYVAVAAGGVVGQLMVTTEWSDWRNGTFWWIQSVYVEARARNQGVFRALYRHVRDLARSRGDVCGLRLYVEQGNRRAQRTYLSLGMTETRYQMLEEDFVLGR
jgi:GNAT superfamily N-acetyltransferase